MNRHFARYTFSRAAHQLQAGVSLIESLVALAVVAVGLGTAVPNFSTAGERRHADGTAAQIETDVMHVRSLAVAQNRNLRMSFAADAEGSCYVVHAGAAGDCRCSGNGSTVCSPQAEALRSVYFAAGAPVQVQANVRSILFDGTKGTTTPTATVRVLGRQREAVHLVVNLMGRVRACSPAAATPGYRAC